MTMKRMLVALVTLLIAAISLVPAAAQDCAPCPDGAICTMECRPIVPGVFTDPDWLKVDHHRVAVEVEGQVARTTIDMAFTNEGDGLAEGTWLFPLPMQAGVEELIMFVDGVAIEARILDAREARAIYDAIVRQYRDPALLEYVGANAVQANVFPIPPGQTRRITLTYAQVLEVDNGLVHYVYPLDVTRLTSRRPVEAASISVRVAAGAPVSNIYSPSHTIGIARDGDSAFSVGWEASRFIADQDFSLYWGVASESIGVNLLTYREGANEDGYFMLLVQPPIEAPGETVIPRDVIIVLDQSGSMDGEKWSQARAAAALALEALNPEDRFNVIMFSTGWRLFSARMEPISEANEAIDWINGSYAEGGTNIDGALGAALEQVEERPTTLLFLTDGLATEGVTDTQSILANVARAARSNVRIFTFGVGNDVDTFLLGALVEAHRGSASYVRPGERIDEEMASLVNKISAPVLTDVTLTIDGVLVESLYPSGTLPDLFAGNQLTIVGRYRGGLDNATLTLTGRVGNEEQTFIYAGQTFRERAGGDSVVARLWATRRIAALLDSIRVNGENPELVDSIVSLSIRFGIITPYTSFLIEEDDILSQQAREEAEAELRAVAQDLGASASGEVAVQAADSFARMGESVMPMATFSAAPAPMTGGMSAIPGTPTPMGTQAAPSAPTDLDRQEERSPIQAVGGKTFILQGTIWTDTTFQPDTMTTVEVAFLSDDYFALIDSIPQLAQFFAVGEEVIVVWDEVAYQVTPSV